MITGKDSVMIILNDEEAKALHHEIVKALSEITNIKSRAKKYPVLTSIKQILVNEIYLD